ncbi:MAG: hypothetical protein ACM3ZQ_01360 [Bacillota bacterium]
MTVTWFSTSRTRGNVVSYQAFKITFTDKPKGVRFNAALTKTLIDGSVSHLKIGVSEGSFIIKPVAEDEDGFKLIANKNSGQVCSAVIGDWATQLGLLKKRVSGIWNAEVQQYEFDLTTVSAEHDDGADDNVEDVILQAAK